MRTVFYTIAIIMLSLASDATAQSKWTFGVKGGIGQSGTNERQVLNSEASDEYSRGRSYSVGARAGYQLWSHIAIVADLEWQHLADKRIRYFNPLGTVNGPVTFLTTYNNTFNRVQMPIQVQLYPIPKYIKLYFIAGIMPSLITGGKFKFNLESNMSTGMANSGETDTDFSIYGNKGLNTNVTFMPGIGLTLWKRLSIEAVRQFGKPMDYATSDSRFSKVGVSIYTTQALSGWMVSAVIKIN